jgi:hypothetical protein
MKVRVDVMIRVTTAAILASLGGALVLPAEPAAAASRPAVATGALPGTPAATDLSAQRRPRTRVRIYSTSAPDDVYPRYDPGPNAVRVCNANYVQEFRPSGTVIVPHVNCRWRRGY